MLVSEHFRRDKMITAIVTQFQNRLITEPEATNELNKLSVRGSFRDDRSYIGYDYANQKWVEVAA